MSKKMFKSESKKLLNLMINSIYTNRDIFLRELISNASDALDKVYLESLTDKKIKVDKDNLAINIGYDKEKRTITITDNGIGMTDNELDDNLGTIAKSGSEAFKESLDKGSKNIDIIGQFGVGFYSAFMVAKKITVDTKSVKSDKSYLWESSGIDGYSVNVSNKKDNGTEITLYLKDDTDEVKYSDYLDENKLKELIKKYSDYIRYPIKMEVTKHVEDPKNKDKFIDKNEIETINTMIPLWKKDKKDVKQEDYDNFYMDRFNDYEAPLYTITSNVEGDATYKALMFIPKKAPYDFYTKDYEKGLALYSSGVMIMDKCSDLLPDYFSFVKGVIDSEDVPLNISRETLQKSYSVRVIAKSVESKIRKELESMLKNDREKYKEFFKVFGANLKYGVYDKFGANKDKLKDLIMFYSAKKQDLITLKEYVDAMSKEQDSIYYASGETVDKIDKMPQLDQVKDKYDILYLTDYVDEFALTALQEYEGKKFVNVLSDNFDLSSKEEKEKNDKMNKDSEKMFEDMKKVLPGVSEVRFSNKLKDHPVALSVKGDISIEMEKVFKSMGTDMPINAEKVLEINENHKIAEKLKDLYKNDKDEFNKYTKILYSEAALMAGVTLDNPTEISDLIVDLLAK